MASRKSWSRPRSGDGKFLKSKKKSKVARVTECKVAVSPTQDVILSPSLAAARVTPKSLQGQAYQKKLHAFFASHLLPDAYNKLRHLILEAPAVVALQAIKTTFESYDVLRPAAKESLNATINVDARTLNVDSQSAEQTRGHANFIRMLAEQRKSKADIPAAARTTLDTTFVETPEGPRQD